MTSARSAGRPSFVDLLREASKRSSSILCFGIDPNVDHLPDRNSVRDTIASFYRDILTAVPALDRGLGAVKPNIGFFERYGIEGQEALRDIIATARELDIPVIVDAKRGDIGRTSDAYAAAFYEDLKVDAVTVSPYMGRDSITPFLERASPDQGQYVLCRTSNPGSSDFQDLVVADGRPVFEHVADAIVEWSEGSTGAVVGAIRLEELSSLTAFFASAPIEVPLLIPGIGKQGGSASEVGAVLAAARSDSSIHRVVSGSLIAEAYLHEDESSYVDAALGAIRRLNAELNYQE